MNFKTFYYFIFFKFYKFFKSHESLNWFVRGKALSIICLLQMCILFSFYNYYKAFVNSDFDSDLILPPTLILLGLIYTINYIAISRTNIWRTYAYTFDNWEVRKWRSATLVVYLVSFIIIANLIVSFLLLNIYSVN